jgi:hypothetical protein
MDDQGAGRTRSAADTRRQPPWRSLEGSEDPESTGPLTIRPSGYDAAGSGAQRILGPGTGPQRLIGTGPTTPALIGPGSGANPVLSRGSGAQPILSRTSGAQPVLSGASGPQPILSRGSGAQPALSPGTGPQPMLSRASGPQPVLSRGSGAQPVLSRGSDPQPTLSRGSDPQPVLSPGSDPQPTLSRGSSAQPVLSPGGDPQPTLGAQFTAQGAGAGGSPARTPVRGFPPGREPTGPLAVGPAEDTNPPGYVHPSDDTVFLGPLDPDDDADQADPPGRPGPQRSGPRRGRGRTKRRFLTAWLATAAVVAAAAGFAGYKFLYEPRVNAPVPPTLRLPTTAPGSSGLDKALGKWQHIGTRAEDPEPLTITGLYPPQFVLNGSSYTRTAASVTKTCSLAVYGAGLQAALQSGHCTQVVRASYISGDGKMMGTVGVVNLISSSAAQKAGQATGPQEIIAPLSSRKGPTKKLGSGTGIVQAKIKGHYLILTWAEFTNLKSPSGSAQRQALEQFGANLLTGTANINLSTRMLSGKQ